VDRARAVLSAGGEVWVGDTTTLREFPPLRAAWAPRGRQAVVVVSGRNARRALHGMLRPATGELVRVVTPRARGADVAQAVAALGAVRPAVAKLLVWDNAPPHHTRPPREAAAAAGIELAYLPFPAPRSTPARTSGALKTAVAANRAYDAVDELAARATAWLDDLSHDDIRRLAGLTTSKFAWLPTLGGAPPCGRCSPGRLRSSRRRYQWGRAPSRRLRRRCARVPRT
jgi:hypothetical protein